MREQRLGRIMRYHQMVISRLERELAGKIGQREALATHLEELAALRKREEEFSGEEGEAYGDYLARWLDQWCLQVDGVKKRREQIEKEVEVLRDRLLEQRMEKEKLGRLVGAYQEAKKAEEMKQEQRICDDLAFLIRK